MKIVTDIQGNVIKPGDLIVSCCGYKKVFAIRVVRKITEASVMYYGHFTETKLDNYSCNNFNIIYRGGTIRGMKIHCNYLNEKQLESYNLLLNEINKNVATADNT